MSFFLGGYTNVNIIIIVFIYYQICLPIFMTQIPLKIAFIWREGAKILSYRQDVDMDLIQSRCKNVNY